MKETNCYYLLYKFVYNPRELFSYSYILFAYYVELRTNLYIYLLLLDLELFEKCNTFHDRIAFMRTNENTGNWWNMSSVILLAMIYRSNNAILRSDNSVQLKTKI